MKVKVISLPYIFQVLYVLCFTRPRYQVSVYRTIGPLVEVKLGHASLVGRVTASYAYICRRPLDAVSSTSQLAFRSKAGSKAGSIPGSGTFSH